MKTYRHKIGEFYKPVQGSHTDGDDEYELLFMLVRKSRTHYDLMLLNKEDDVPCSSLDPDSMGIVRAKKTGKGRLFFVSKNDDEDFYECELEQTKE